MPKNTSADQGPDQAAATRYVALSAVGTHAPSQTFFDSDVDYQIERLVSLGAIMIAPDDLPDNPKVAGDEPDATRLYAANTFRATVQRAVASGAVSMHPSVQKAVAAAAIDAQSVPTEPEGEPANAPVTTTGPQSGVPASEDQPKQPPPA